MSFKTGGYSKEFEKAFRYYNSSDIDKKDVAYKLWCARNEPRWKKETERELEGIEDAEWDI